jgi:hypothetical protein
MYTGPSSLGGLSATQPAISVNERIPPTIAAATRVNSAATG